jgi:hypothetical protein
MRRSHLLRHATKRTVVRYPLPLNFMRRQDARGLSRHKCDLSFSVFSGRVSRPCEEDTLSGARTESKRRGTTARLYAP